MSTYRFTLLLLIVLFASFSVSAQEVEDTIKIKTRVVFLDALVKDKKTNLPISNLTSDNFAVLDEGKPRNITYFTREGQARKPLALVLILDLREDGAGRFLKRTEILKSMEDELAKLPPGDEVAILAMDINNEDEERLWLTEFTNDRATLAAALARVPAMCEPHEGSTKTAAATTQGEGKPDDIVETETIRGRNGGVVTRATRRDGRVNVTRTNKDGKMTIELGDVYDMAAAVKEAARKAAELRPNSQTSIVWVSDGIAPIFYEDRDATQQILIRDNVIFNSLTVELRTLFKFLMPIGKPIAGWMGMSLYGSAKYLAQQSGGEAVKVGRVKDYGAGLQRIIGNLTARYSLGFALAEDENDDGRMHALEVRVNAKDEKGKTRKLQVSSRQGYYMSSTEAAVKAQ
ncbi:MAG TPA: VWA domain-containing protein [Pyrinomonadaceae bacterium]|jgi:VWFA-related protein|nr:VWA domain-containing protein [Pyrinomonadaceae bacterium]